MRVGMSQKKKKQAIEREWRQKK